MTQKVTVAIYKHEYGEDVKVFDSCEKALEWREIIAAEWWPDAFGELPSLGEIGETYFEKMGKSWSDAEYFETHECEVE